MGDAAEHTGRPLLTALILAGCWAAAPASASPLRDVLAAGGGCGPHRALVDARLGGPDGSPAAAGPEADLFGKPAQLWSEAEIRDALAVYAACEGRGGRPAEAARRARDLARFEAALRRVIALSRAQAPVPDAAPHQPRRAEAGAQAPADLGGQPSRTGPAFVPTARGADETPTKRSRSVFETPDEENRVARVAETGPDPLPPGLPPRVPVAPPAPAQARLSAFAAVPPERPPASERLHCPVVLRTFENLRADMLLPEVENVMGCRGTLESSTTVAGIGDLDVYVWSDRAQSFTVTTTFQNRRLRVKSQRGLN